MTRMEAQERLAAAARDAYAAGLQPEEIQDALAFGAHDAGRPREKWQLEQGVLPDLAPDCPVCEDFADGVTDEA